MDLCNCQQTIDALLCDIPYQWRKGLVDALCYTKHNTQTGNENICDCETLTSLSSFTDDGEIVSINYKNEKGTVKTSKFNLAELIDAPLDIDPECVITSPPIVGTPLVNQIQAILTSYCSCCETTTTTSTTTTTTVDPFDYYEARQYDCLDCSLVDPEFVIVKLIGGTGVILGNYYVADDYDGYSYRLIQPTYPQPALDLTNSLHNSSCGTVCPPPPTTTTTTTTSTTTTSTTTTSTTTTSTTTTTTEAPSFMWIAGDTVCETEGAFGMIRSITGMSSPINNWYDDVTGRLYFADADSASGNVGWYSDIASATTVSDATFSTAVTFNPVYNSYIDTVYRRIYLVGSNTGGMIVYDIDTDTASTVAFGTNLAFARTTLFVSGNLILCNDGVTAMVTIARDTLTVTATIPMGSITNPGKFTNPHNVAMAGGRLYVVSNNGPIATVGVYDTSLNHFTEITLPSASTWTGGTYWQSILYDPTSDRLFVGDYGSSRWHVIDPNTNTVSTTTFIGNRGNKSAATSWFVIDPQTDNLYMLMEGRNSASDTASVKRTYVINRSTFIYENMYNDVVYYNLAAIPSLGWFTGTDRGAASWEGGSWFSDGLINIVSNSAGITNTGNLLTQTLIEVTDPGGTPTGNEKANLASDPDYIAPVMDDDSCPVVYNTDCPAEAYLTQSGDTLYYEFAIPNSVRFNPVIDLMQVYWRDDGVRQVSNGYSPINGINFYGASFDVTTAVGVIDVEIVYLDAGSNELDSCIITL